MSGMSESPLRSEVLKFISKSASFGNLGVFIGAGFSKAVLNDSFDDIALSWGELLERASEKLDVNYGEIQKEGVGYPDIASSICQNISDEKGISYDQALKKLKFEISSLTSWYPDKEKREEYSKYLSTLSPSWIITTNYDLVIESLLTGKAIPLGPNDPLVVPSYAIPVYHLHGLRTNPEEIVIAQEDYVALFRPNEYRQIKLALTIRESTTLIVGYGIGDVNVLTALDWSKNVFSGKQENYPHDVIQVVRKNNPKEEPYRDKNGILIVETSELKSFFKEFSSVREESVREELEEMKNLEDLALKLDDPDSSMIETFIDDNEFRGEMLKTLSNFSIHLISGFVSFISKCIDETWARSEPNAAFEGYNQNLILILDILTTFNVDKIPPALFEITAYALQRVGYYVSDGHGKSWESYETWNNRKSELSPEMISELNNFADQYEHTYIRRLMKSI